MTRSNLTRLFTLLVVILTTFQASIPTIPISNEATVVLISAITMFLVTGLTAWKQAISIEISDKALWPTIVVAVIATLGGLNDLIGAVHIGDQLAQWLRFAITLTIMILNVSSKNLWPTYEAKQVENLKQNLKDTK